MEMIPAELVLDAGALLGEGPCWDARSQQLFWVDIEGFELHITDPAIRLDRVIDVGQHVGAVAIRKSGGVMLALREGFAHLDLEIEALTIIHDPERHLPENRFNDGKCDPAGRFWAGTMALSAAPGCGSLYCLDTDLTVHHRMAEVSISNGMAWSLDERTMYYIDSLAHSVSAFDYDKATGEIAHRRDVIHIPHEMGTPDGMTIDIEGMLWVALWDGSRVCRWNPQTGELLETVVLPVTRPTSCAFGGPDLDILYITSASTRLDEKTLASQPLAGGLFMCHPGVRGLPAGEFAG